MTAAYVPPLRFKVLTPLYDWVVSWSTAEDRFRPALVELVAEGNPAAILEIGCGTGSLSWQLAMRLPQASVTGLDADPDALAIAGAKGRGGSAPAFLRGDARSLAVESTSVDAVVASLFFHHLDDGGKAAVLGEIRRVLRPDGRLLIGDWGRPAGALAWLGFQAVRTLDGFENTRQHASGRFPDLLAAEGFDVGEEGTLAAIAGTLYLWTARIAGTPRPMELSKTLA